MPAITPPEEAPAASDADVWSVLDNGIREISGEVRNSLDFHRSQDGGATSRTSCSAAPPRTSPASPRRCRPRSASRCAPAALHVARTASTAASRRTGWRSRPGSRPRRLRNESRQPDPRRPAQRCVGRRRALAGRRLRGARRARRGSPCWLCSTAKPATRSRAERTRGGQAHRPGADRRRPRRPRSRRTRASSRCANSARRRSPRWSTRASTGRTRCTSSAACCRSQTSISSLGRPDRQRHPGSCLDPCSGSTAASASVSSATPPGSVPTFTSAAAPPARTRSRRRSSACA